MLLHELLHATRYLRLHAHHVHPRDVERDSADGEKWARELLVEDEELAVQDV